MDLSRLATTAARAAADHLRRVERPRDPAGWRSKGHHDFVTESDRAAEEIIAESLLRSAPGSSVLGEELSPERAATGLVWIVDPIDGTTNFIHGFPVWAVSIAAEVDGVLEAGVVLHVEANHLYHAARGHGAWRDDQRLSVSEVTDPGHALIGTGFPFKHLEQLPRYQAQFAGVAAGVAGIRRAGSASLDLSWIASGAFDGFWELGLAAWDIAAGLVLVREAGGAVTDLEGAEIGARDTPVVAGNRSIHRWLLGELAATDRRGPA